MKHRAVHFVLLVAILATGFFATSASHAYSFTPTENEWATWPDYCKARYAESVFGAQSIYGKRVPNSVKAQWRNNLGRAYQPLHHYCAGLAYMQREAATVNTESRERNLRFALNEFGYTFARVPESSYLFPEVAINYGLALQKDGQRDRALAMLNSALDADPKNSSAYAAMSIMYGRMEQTAKQGEILRKGIAATNGESAELHYFMGLHLAKNKQYEEARKHAIEAYRLGYPLPGLKNRLARAGYKLTES